MFHTLKLRKNKHLPTQFSQKLKNPFKIKKSPKNIINNLLIIELHFILRNLYPKIIKKILYNSSLCFKLYFSSIEQNNIIYRINDVPISTFI